jgi:uncharacterized protein involved in type VI secretion and phage assembly
MDHPAEQLQTTLLEVARRQRSRLYGKYSGIVTDNVDPDNQGRIQATVPTVFDAAHAPWAKPSVPFAPSGAGMLMLPEIGSNVWIEFENGDQDYPIWSGCYWPQNQAPSLSSASVKVLFTKAGNKITLDDTDGSESIILEDKSGNKITMNQQGIELKKGSMSVKLTDSQVSINDGALTVS